MASRIAWPGTHSQRRVGSGECGRSADDPGGVGVLMGVCIRLVCGHGFALPDAEAPNSASDRGGGGAVIPLVSPGRFPFRRFPIGTSRGLGAFVEWKPEMGWRILHPLGVEPGVIGRFQLARSDRFWGISSPMPWAVFRGIGPSPSPLLSSPLLSSPLLSDPGRCDPNSFSSPSDRTL